MRLVAVSLALAGLVVSVPAAAQAPALGQFEVKAYQVIPKAKTAVQLNADSALARNLRRQVMLRLSKRGNEVGFSGGNVMKFDVTYVDLLGGSGGSIDRGPVGGIQDFQQPGSNPIPQVPGVTIRRRDDSAPTRGGPTLRLNLTLYHVDTGRVLWAATASCVTTASMAERAGEAIIDTIFDNAEKTATGDAGCPL